MTARVLIERILVSSLTALVASCSLLPQAQKVTDPRSVYVWPVESCPSTEQPEPAHRAFFANILGLLLGNVVSGIVGIPAGALNAAAEADKAGFTSSGTNPRLYYTVTEGIDASDNNTKKVKIIPPECYVVALSRPVSQQIKWCDDLRFAAGVPQSCANGSTTLHALSGKEILEKPHMTPRQHLSVPEFYAEISFDQSEYGRVVRPRLAALYYPASLLQTKSKQPRTISLTIVPTSTLNNDPFKAASVAIRLVGIAPAPAQSSETLELTQTAWTSIPAISAKPGDPQPSAGKPYLPVTMTATLHEVGQPSLFLAAFANAFSASTGDYTKAISGESLPASQQAAQQQADTNEADYNAKYAAAMKSWSDYLAACSKNPTSEADKANIENLWYAVVANRIKANVAASVTGKKPKPFDTPDGGRQC